ncbi:hypothetical protein NEOLI_001602, partial [Neolecta irregularis DAH-3]
MRQSVLLTELASKDILISSILDLHPPFPSLIFFIHRNSLFIIVRYISSKFGTCLVRVVASWFYNCFWENQPRIVIRANYYLGSSHLITVITMIQLEAHKI